MTPSSSPAWLVTGASSGFGRAIVEAAAARGHAVVATARDVATVADLADRHPNVRALALDVADPTSIADAVATAGPVGVLVNNAGYGLLGAVEDLPDDELEAAFAVNLFGPLRLTRAVLPQMRARGAGHIVQMSSVIGVTSGPGGAAYAGPKAALEAMSVALAAEVAPLGIRVTIVEPGAFRTDFSGRSLRVASPSPGYEPMLRPSTEAFRAGHGTQPGDPRRGADVIVDTVEGDAGPLRLPLGQDAMTWLKTALTARLDELGQAPPAATATAFEALSG